jgi:ATP-dependent 26S proteasome regulatory subunit
MGANVDVLKELETQVRAKYPIVYVVTWEEQRAEQGISAIATTLNRTFHQWSLTQGMQPACVGQDIQQKLSSLPSELQALAAIRESSDGRIFVIRDFHPYMKDARVIRMLRDLSNELRSKRQTLILMSPTLVLPTELEKDVTVLEFPLPTHAEISTQLDEVLASVNDLPGVDTSLTPEQREILVKSSQGLTRDEIESAFARSIVIHKRLEVDVILEEKKQIVRKSGLLEFYPAQNSFKDVGGHEILKDWLEKRAKGFTNKAKEFGIPAPKGVLLLGVQGCGKSLVAKAIAATWNLPMLKLDIGRIFGSFVGQSEENIRRAIAVAESVSPCCLWADELEKGFGGVSGSGGGDNGTTKRVFATFLTWMQEKTKPVFLIATANDVSALPPELLRKGRFDEIFFIDLPDRKERQEIFAIHLSKRQRDPKKFDLEVLAELANGFSGAEIEQVVVASLFHAFDAGRDLIQEDLVKEASTQVPLSRMMSEEIAELREWASTRARPSSEPGE